MRSSHRSCKPRQQANEPRLRNHFSHCFLQHHPWKSAQRSRAACCIWWTPSHEFWAVDFAWGLKCTIYYLVSPCVQICRRYEAAGILKSTMESCSRHTRSNSSFLVLVKPPKCFISRSTRIGACNSQLFWYIFNPVFTVVKRDIPSVRSNTRFRSYTRVICEHDCNMKHACRSEFNFTNIVIVFNRVTKGISKILKQFYKWHDPFHRQTIVSLYLPDRMKTPSFSARSATS